MGSLVTILSLLASLLGFTTGGDHSGFTTGGDHSGYTTGGAHSD